MKSRHVVIIGVLVLGAVLFLKPVIPSAAARSVAAVEQQSTVAVDQDVSSAAPGAGTAQSAGQDIQQLIQACIDAHKLPTVEQRIEAMNKLMSDPNLVGKMNQIMRDPKLAGQMTQFMNSPEGRSWMWSMMSGWRAGQSRAANGSSGGSSAATTGSFGCH